VRVRIHIEFVLIMVGMFWVLSGCQQAAGPDDAARPEIKSSTARDAVFDGIASAAGIKHLLIASVETQFLGFIEDPSAVSEVVSLLTETELSMLVQRRIVRVEDPGRAAVIAAIIVGPNVSDPAMTAGGLLVSTYRKATWGQIKCCYKDKKCCPQKKAQ